MRTALHEDVEDLERLIVKDFKQEVRTHKERLMQNHRVKRRLDLMSEASRKLVRETCGRRGEKENQEKG